MTSTPHHMSRMGSSEPRGYGAVGDARKRQEAYPTAAEALCLVDDTWAHHDATDDFPCTACITKADILRAHVAAGGLL